MTRLVQCLVLFLLAPVFAKAQPNITLPEPDHLSAYPIGINDISYPRVQYEVTTRYNGRPLILLLPYEKPPHPVIVFNHGRPFQMPSDRPMGVNKPLVEQVLKRGWALALPVRSGYFLDDHRDREIIKCWEPGYDEFVAAGTSADNDVSDVINYLSSLEIIDAENIIVAGTSAGGFASIASLQSNDARIRGVISVNGGRCGKQGYNVGGVHHITRYFETIAVSSQSPVIFLAGSLDETIPEETTYQLFEAFKRARGDKEVWMQTNPRGTHSFSSMDKLFGRAMDRLTRH